MTEKRDFLIQRYSDGNWDYVLGFRPFIVTGPNFKSWAIPGSLEKHREWRFRVELRFALSKCFPEGLPYANWFWQDAIAEFLLREGIVQALWSVDAPAPVPEPDRWDLSVNEVARQIHYALGVSISESTIELLSGMGGPEHYRAMLAEDSMKLEPVVIPPEID